MPRQPKPFARVTIYQLEGSVDPAAVLRAKYLDRDEFEIYAVSIGDREGFFVRGTVESDQAQWAKLVGGWLQDDSTVTGLGNRTAAAVLLIPTRTTGSGRIWALSFGMGFHLLDPALVVPALGRRVAVRCAVPERIRSITHSRLDSRAYVARTSIPGGDDIGGFGASELGDFVSRIVGPAELEGILAATGDRSVELRGADSLNLPLARDAEQLLRDLDAIEELLEREPLPELAILDHVRPLKTADPIIAQLNEALEDALGNPDELKLGLAWPTELADEAMPLSHFSVTGLGPERQGHELEVFLEPLRELPARERVQRLDRVKVQAFSDDDDPISNALPARRWLSFETLVDDHRFCMHDGRWYVVDEGLDELLRVRLTEIFAAEAGIDSIPEWPESMDEAEFNLLLAERLGGVCLDRKLVRCASNRRGFESCDVLTQDGVFVHVKKIGRSTGASHLFAQAGVSAQTLLDDGTARTALLKVVEAAGGNRDWVPERPQSAVLVMGNRKLLDEKSLFAFSGMRLVRLADELRRQGVSLSLIPVAYTE